MPFSVARARAKALKAKLCASEKIRIVKKQTFSIDAYSLYLKGRFTLHKRNRQAIDEAIKLFSQAVERDPKYARAYAGLADCYLLTGSYGHREALQAYESKRVCF